MGCAVGPKRVAQTCFSRSAARRPVFEPQGQVSSFFVLSNSSGLLPLVKPVCGPRK
jgi:hypothetical protein